MPDIRSLIPIHREIAERIREMFPDESDENLADTIEGESDLPRAIVTVVRAAIEREANGKALAEIIEVMVGRKRRLEEGARNLRLAALHAMEAAALRKVGAPDMSVSVVVSRPKLLVTDETAVPDDLCKVVRTPSKTMIASAIAEGREVPGTAFGNAETYLTVHRK